MQVGVVLPQKFHFCVTVFVSVEIGVSLFFPRCNPEVDELLQDSLDPFFVAALLIVAPLPYVWMMILHVPEEHDGTGLSQVP